MLTSHVLLLYVSCTRTGDITWSRLGKYRWFYQMVKLALGIYTAEIVLQGQSNLLIMGLNFFFAVVFLIVAQIGLVA